jgi:hypothetical protein
MRVSQFVLAACDYWFVLDYAVPFAIVTGAIGSADAEGAGRDFSELTIEPTQ